VLLSLPLDASVFDAGGRDSFTLRGDFAAAILVTSPIAGRGKWREGVEPSTVVVTER
jgi:hypothetical protein